MKSYNKQTTCGELIVEIEEKEGKYVINVKMNKFGDCSAYKFISKVIEDKVNKSQDINKLLEEIKSFKCTQGLSGCIEEIGKCLQEYFQSKKL